MGKVSRRRAQKEQQATAAAADRQLAVPQQPPQQAVQPAAALAPLAESAAESGITSSHVWTIAVVAQALVLYAIQPNGKGPNHYSVPLWAVLIELGIITAALLQVYRWLNPPPPPPPRPPQQAQTLSLPPIPDIPAGSSELVAELLQQQLLITSMFEDKEVAKLVPHLLPLLDDAEHLPAQARDAKIAELVRDAEDEKLRQRAKPGVTHVVTLINVTTYSGKTFVALQRMLFGEWRQWEGEGEGGFWQVFWHEADMNDDSPKGTSLLYSLSMAVLGILVMHYCWMPTIRWHVLGQRARIRKPVVQRSRTQQPLLSDDATITEAD